MAGARAARRVSPRKALPTAACSACASLCCSWRVAAQARAGPVHPHAPAASHPPIRTRVDTPISLPCRPRAAAPSVRLSFSIPYRTEWGQDVALVGDKRELGEWDPRRGVSMRWQEGDVWSADVEVSARCVQA